MITNEKAAGQMTADCMRDEADGAVKNDGKQEFGRGTAGWRVTEKGKWRKAAGRPENMHPQNNPRLL